MRRALLTIISTVLFAASVTANTSITVTFDANDPSVVVTATTVQQTVEDVTLTMRGYQLEIYEDGSEKVFGPAPTSSGGRKMFNYDPGDVGQPGISFYSFPAPGYDVIETDDLVSAALPGFDSKSNFVAESFEWMEIEFSRPVDVSWIEVDNHSNWRRDIWAIGSDTPFDYSSGLTAAISGLSAINSPTAATGDPLRHEFSPLFGIRYLLIGAPPEGSDFGPIQQVPSSPLFSITGLGFEICPFVTTVTSTRTLLRASGAQEGASVLPTLRRFRDEIMSQHAEGGRHIELFYRHAAEVTWQLAKNPGLRGRLRALMVRTVPTVQARVSGRRAAMARRDLVEIADLLEAVANGTSARARADLLTLRDELIHGSILDRYGIAIGSGQGSRRRNWRGRPDR